MVRTARKPLSAVPKGREQSDEMRVLGDRVCAWEPISRGRLDGRIVVTQLRGALISFQHEPEQRIVEGILDAWFGNGQWRLEKQDVDGEMLDVALRNEPPSMAPRAMRA